MQQLTKSQDKVFGGVLGGIGNYFGIDPVIVRIIFLLFVFLGDAGTAIFLYIIALFIMPEGNEVINPQRTFMRKDWHNYFISERTIMFLGFTLIILGLLFLIDQIYQINLWYYYRLVKSYFWPVILILIGVLILYKKGKK